MHFDDGLADKSGEKEFSEGDTEVSTSDTSQIKQRIWDGGTQEDSDKPIFFHIVVDENFRLIHQ